MKIMLDLASANSGQATIGGRRYRDLANPARTVGAIIESDAFHPGRSGRNHLRILADATGCSYAGSTRCSNRLDSAKPQTEGPAPIPWACASGSAWLPPCSESLRCSSSTNQETASTPKAYGPCATPRGPTPRWRHRSRLQPPARRSRTPRRRRHRHQPGPPRRPGRPRELQQVASLVRTTTRGLPRSLEQPAPHREARRRRLVVRVCRWPRSANEPSPPGSSFTSSHPTQGHSSRLFLIWTTDPANRGGHRAMTMKRLIRSELRKLTSTKMPWAFLACPRRDRWHQRIRSDRRHRLRRLQGLHLHRSRPAVTRGLRCQRVHTGRPVRRHCRRPRVRPPHRRPNVPGIAPAASRRAGPARPPSQSAELSSAS